MSRIWRITIGAGVLMAAGFLWSSQFRAWADKREQEVTVRAFVVAKNHFTRAVAGMRVIAVPADVFEARLAAPDGEVQSALAEFLGFVEACAATVDAYRKDGERIDVALAKDKANGEALVRMMQEMVVAVAQAEKAFDAQVESEAVRLIAEEHNRAFSQAAAKIDLIYMSGHPRLVELRIDIVRLLRAATVADVDKLAAEAAAEVRRGADSAGVSRRRDAANKAPADALTFPAFGGEPVRAADMPAVGFQRRSMSAIIACKESLRAFRSDASNFTLRGESSASGVRKIVGQIEDLIDECDKIVGASDGQLGSYTNHRADGATHLDLLLNQRIQAGALYRANAAARDAVFRKHREGLRQSGFLSPEGLGRIDAAYAAALGDRMTGACDGFDLLAAEHASGATLPSDSALVKAMWAAPGRLFVEPPLGFRGLRQKVTLLQYQRETARALLDGFCDEVRVIASGISPGRPVNQASNEARIKMRREFLDYVVQSSRLLRTRVGRLAIVAYFPTSHAVASGITDDQGSCRLKLPKGRYYICASSGIYGHWTVPVHINDESPVVISNDQLRGETVPFGVDLLGVSRARKETPWALKTSMAQDALPVSTIPNAASVVSKLGDVESAMRAAEAVLRPLDHSGDIDAARILKEMGDIEKALQPSSAK